MQIVSHFLILCRKQQNSALLSKQSYTRRISSERFARNQLSFCKEMSAGVLLSCRAIRAINCDIFLHLRFTLVLTLSLQQIGVVLLQKLEGLLNFFNGILPKRQTYLDGARTEATLSTLKLASRKALVFFSLNFHYTVHVMHCSAK